MSIVSSTETELVMFHYLMDNPELVLRVRPDYFKNQTVKVYFQLLSKYHDKFSLRNKCSIDQLEHMLTESEYATQVIDLEKEQIKNLDLNKYDEDYLQDAYSQWVGDNKLYYLTRQITEKVKMNISKVDSGQLMDQISEMIKNEKQDIIEDDLGIDFFNPDHYQDESIDKLPSGFQFIDRVTNGGYDKKSVFVSVGPSNIGKSIFLVNQATQLVRNGSNVLFVSLEMDAVKVLKRASANILDFKVSEYSNMSKNKNALKLKLDGLAGGFPPGVFRIKKFDTGRLNVPDLEAYILKVQEKLGVKFDAIVLDYINILEDRKNPKGDMLYLKIKNITEDLRGMADANDWVVISATQSTGDAYNSSNIDLQNVAESKGLVHTVDIIFGIIQTDEMKNNNRYYYKLLKNRDGEGKGLAVTMTIDYDRMRLEETGEIVTM